MTVSRAKKAERLRIASDHIRRVHAETGLNAYEQFLASPAAKVAPVHRQINEKVWRERDPATAERIPPKPGSIHRRIRDNELRAWARGHGKAGV